MALTGMGFSLATSIVLMTVVGRLLDRWLGTSPVFTLAGLLIGLLAGFYGAYQQLREVIGRGGR